MPIIDLQRRLREIGRIRLGERIALQDGKTRPKKLSTFRFTARDRTPIETVAGVFGGTVEAWSDAPGGEQWQVITPTDAIDVVIPPTDMAFSQWYEQWSAGGCVARCDGEREVLHDRACVCDPNDRLCKPHTRLSLMIPAVPALGVWRLDTLGWNAATELAGAVEAVQMAAVRNVMLPARLLLDLRQEKKIIDGKAQTRKFAVPVLDLDVSMLIAGAARMAATSGDAIEPAAAKFTPVPPLPGIGVSVPDQLRAGPREVVARSNSAAPILATGLRPPQRGQSLAEIASDGDDTVGVPSSGPGLSGPPGVSQRPQPDSPDTIDVASTVLPAGAPTSGGESGAGVLDSPPPSDHDGPRLAAAQQIAIRAADAGLDDERRHEFIDAFTGGRTRSGKDILPEEMADLMAQLVRYKRGEIRIHRPEGEPSQLVRVETTDTSDKADTDRDPELWTDTEWHTAIQAAGLKQPAVLRFARRAAQDGGIDAPGTLGEITSPFLATQVRDWIDQNARETP